MTAEPRVQAGGDRSSRRRPGRNREDLLARPAPCPVGAVRTVRGCVARRHGDLVTLTRLAQKRPVVGFVHQVVVGTAGDNASAFHDGDAVGAAHGRRAVGDDQDGSILGQGAQCLLDLGLGLGIGHGGGLVEQDDGGVQQDGAGDGDALLLSAGQGRVPSQDGVVAVRQGHDLLINPGDAGSGTYLVQVGVGASERDVLPHSGAEQLGVLEDEGDRGVQGGLVHVAQVHASDAHAPGVGVGEAGDEGGQCRLARAGGPQQSGDGAGLQSEAGASTARCPRRRRRHDRSRLAPCGAARTGWRRAGRGCPGPRTGAGPLRRPAGRTRRSRRW